MTTGHALASIAVMAGVTFLTRALPFLLFDRGERPPKLVLYLGQVLPPAIIAMLIIYCLRGTSFAQPAGWVPALLASAAAVRKFIYNLITSIISFLFSIYLDISSVGLLT